MPEHRAFFGDRERSFKLGTDEISELERSTGRGIGRLSRETFAGDFHHRDLTEIIRLGLIGGGEKPERAAELMRVYAAIRPIGEVYPLAVSILECLWGFTEPAEHSVQSIANPEPETTA